MARPRRCLLILLALLTAFPLAAEWDYIVPVWVRNHQGGDAQWTSSLVISNPHARAVTVRIDEVLPLGVPCIECTPPGPFEIAARGRLILEVTPGLPSAAAFSLHATAPLHIEHLLFGASGRFSITDIPTFSQWLPATADTRFEGLLNSSGTFRCNLFLGTPESRDARGTYEYETPGARRYEAVVPARS